ncbi:MAG: TonB-dependent receptor [Ignavibacteriales bacterium]|nr:TonB-dependent receptor [Ignavibacteriales bacterium]
MMMHLYIVFLFVALEFCVAQPLRGVISGTVRDSATGQALIGANVIVRGTVVGAATDRSGSFRLSFLPPGTYTVRASMIGYASAQKTEVRVMPGGETEISFSLTPVIIETEPVVVTASRREQNLREVPVSITTVTAGNLQERNIITMDEALRYVPGVNLLQDQVNIRGSSGYSRGVGSRVLLLLDGLPFLTGDTGEINWETIPVGEVERVEIVKGAGSALYGSSALGGVINVLTREMPDNPELRYRVFTGVYDRPRFAEWDWSDRLRLNSGGVFSYANAFGSLRYLLSVSRTVDESYRENDTYHRWMFFGKAKYLMSENRSLSVVFNLLRRTHGNFFWWKSLREATIPPESQRNGMVTSNRGHVSTSYKEFLSDRLFYTVKGMYFGNFWRDDSLGRVNNVSSSHVFQLDMQVTYEVNSRSIFMAGIAGNVDEVSSNLFGRHRGYGIAAYAQEEFVPFDPVRLTIGARYDMQKASALAAAARLSPKLAVAVPVSNETTFRGSIGAGFRYPSIGELFISSSTNVSQIVILPNLNLRPEKSLTFELGFAHTIGSAVALDGAVFWNDFKDLIEPSVKIKKIKLNPTDTVEVNRAVIEFENVTTARVQGAEIAVKTQWFGRTLSTDVGYTYIWPRDLDQNAILKFRPRHLLYGSASLAVSDVKLSCDYRYISRVERIDDNLIRLAPIIHGDRRVPIHVMDVRVSSLFSPFNVPVRVGAIVNNLFNYHYVELVGNLAPVRTYMVTLEGAL